MLRFSAHLSMLFTEVDFLDRFEAAARAGFGGVEYMGPYDFDKRVIAELLQTHKLTQVLFNMPAGNRAAGDRGIACQPGRRAEFLDSVGLALDYAVALGCVQINCLAGNVPPDLAPQAAHETYVENLRYVAAHAARQNVRVVIEPLNPIDFPGFFLTRTDQAAAIVAEVGSPNLGIEYDVFHAQKSEGNLADTIERHFPLMWHLQIADVPTRQERGTGEIRFNYLFEQLERLGYGGWIGCDYHPSKSGGRHLDWLVELRRSNP